MTASGDSEPRGRVGRPSRRTLFTGVTWILLALAIFYFVQGWPSGDDWLRLLSANQLLTMGALIACFAVTTLARGVRWNVLLDDTVRAAPRTRILAFGWFFFLMAFSPFKVGEAARPVWVRRQGGSASRASGALVVERLADMFALVGMLAIVAAFGPQVPDWVTGTGMIALLACISVLLLVAFRAGAISSWLRRALSQQEADPGHGRVPTSWLRIAVHAIDGMGDSVQASRSVPMVGLTLIAWGVLGIGFSLYLTTEFSNLHWTAPVAVLCAVNLSALVSVAPGNIGVYELVAAATLSAYGIAANDALVAAVGLHVAVLVAIMLVGVVGKLALVKAGQRAWDVL